MNTRQILKRSDTVVGLVRDLRKIAVLITKLFTRDGLITRDRLIKSYLDSNEIKKLQIGAGPITLPGWLSTDIAHTSDRVVYLDATEMFPFDDNTFDYVFSEHMIEHIPWHKGLFMLKECRRVLKPRGTIRLATPDLEVLIGLYIQNENALNERYIEWITDRFLNDVNAYKASFVINNAFRNWGHQFLYDGDLLVMTMQKAGFTNIRRGSLGESNDENLRGIESHGGTVNNDDMARFETMVFEGECPV
jgi:predicted SAM-dependent methyltransferase